MGLFFLHLNVFIPLRRIHTQRPLAVPLFHGFLLLNNMRRLRDLCPPNIGNYFRDDNEKYIKPHTLLQP